MSSVVFLPLPAFPLAQMCKGSWPWALLTVPPQMVFPSWVARVLFCLWHTCFLFPRLRGCLVVLGCDHSHNHSTCLQGAVTTMSSSINLEVQVVTDYRGTLSAAPEPALSLDQKCFSLYHADAQGVAKLNIIFPETFRWYRKHIWQRKTATRVISTLSLFWWALLGGSQLPGGLVKTLVTVLGPVFQFLIWWVWERRICACSHAELRTTDSGFVQPSVC